MKPKGVEECICYQRSDGLGFKWFHIKLGLTSAIEIKHQHMIKKELNGICKRYMELNK